MSIRRTNVAITYNVLQPYVSAGLIAQTLILKTKFMTKEKVSDEAPKPALRKGAVRFQLPSDKQMIDIAILFNDGKLERQKLADMVAYGQFIVDRLYKNGDVGIPSSKEEGN